MKRIENITHLLGSVCETPCTKWQREDFTFEIVNGILEITTYDSLCFCFMKDVREATQGIEVLFKLYRGRVLN